VSNNAGAMEPRRTVIAKGSVAADDLARRCVVCYLMAYLIFIDFGLCYFARFFFVGSRVDATSGSRGWDDARFGFVGILLELRQFSCGEGIGRGR